MTELRALVTGMLGFCGRHLCSHLAEQGYEVFGIDTGTGAPVASATLFAGDIRDPAFLQQVLQCSRPSHLFHLAALTAPQADWEQLFDVNVRGTLRLLEAVHLNGQNPALVVTGSSAAYGRVAEEELPISESQPFRPMSMYAVSKIAQEMLAHTYYVRYGLRVVRARAFNLTGPGESPSFVTSAFARQIAEIEAGKRPPSQGVHVGNLSAVRDLTDVRDAVRAYRLIAERGQAGIVYNVCSERGTPIREVLDRLLAQSQIPGIVVQVDPSRLQAADVPIQVGDAALLRRTAGWSPAISLQQTLRDVLDYWRKQLEEQ